MKVSGTKKGIQTIIPQNIAPPVKDAPVQRKRERITDIQDMQLSDEVDNLRLQIARLRNENMDLQDQIKNVKNKEQERYNRMLLFWKMLYEVTPESARSVAKEFGVDPKRREFSHALEDFDALFQAVCKAMFANEVNVHDINIAIERAQKQADDERFRREHSEKELQRERKEKEKLILLFETEKMKKKDEIMIRFGSFLPVVAVAMPESDPHIKLEEELNEELNQELEEQMKSVVHENEILELAEEDLVVSLLKEKEYEVIPSDNPKHNYIVGVDNKQVPLRYFDYALMDGSVFEEIMEGTNEIYLVFDNKENCSKGNTAWTRWLLFSKRKPHIRFSMTTLDDLRKKGLNKIV